MATADDVIWTDVSELVSVRLTHTPSAAVIALLSRTLWGSHGLLYRICNMEAKLQRLAAPYVFTLDRQGQMAAVCILDRKTVNMAGTDYDAFHFVMIATDDAFKGQGLAALLSEQIRRFCESELRPPAVAYAYIEATTEYSIRISEDVGHRFEAFVPLTIFNRFRPHDDDRVRHPRVEELGTIATELNSLYAGHGFTDFERSLRGDEYFVLSDNGDILAGVQAEMLHWSVVRLPGWMGRVIVNIVPHMPLLGRRLNVGNLRFLRFGNILARPGRETALIDLMEAVLARHNLIVGLILMDEKSPVYERIKSHGRLGLLSAVVTGKSKVVADFKGLTATEVADINARPMVVSARDVI
jgi:hypothetical protein